MKKYLFVLLLASCTASKKATQSPDQLVPNLKSHISYLASDMLEGRRTGTKGEELAMEYISSQFKAIGLSPKGTESYTQSFVVNDGKMMNEVNVLSLGGVELKAGQDYFVYPFSPDAYVDKTVSAIQVDPGRPAFVDLKKTLETNKDNPHFDLAAEIRRLVETFRGLGASAIVVYNSSSLSDHQVFEAKDKTATTTIPVVYVNYDVIKTYAEDRNREFTFKLRTSIGEKTRIGHNVIGYIDNKAPTTIILGAHYDHLGYGEDGNSMIRTGEKNIHNGADDNASGTASLIELGRMLKTDGPKNSNYLFIAFSGEELGLFGSKYFTENPTIALNTVNYMINMDMVGRLNDSTHTLTIGGIGTSPAWGDLRNHFTGSAAMNIKIDSSGTGPSDHTSFYRKDIPVLFYFTGLHSDYHKPSDDEGKINYAGMNSIINHIYGVISSSDSLAKFAFTKTREAQTTTSARFSVSLGVMPDYTYSGTGLRIDGVSDGRPAQKAGLQAGDIILKIGEHTVSSMETYMQALGKFKKGDKTTVVYKRGEGTVEVPVEF